MRLQVFLSHSGACSRRKALHYIRSGQVTVNDRQILEPSYLIDRSCDIVKFQDKIISSKEKRYILLHKPSNVVTTTQDRFAKRTVLDLLPKQLKHLRPVGRLDKNTTGLLLLTNDGFLSHRLSHPSFGVEKVYRVVLDRILSDEDRRRLERGILLEEGRTSPSKIRKISLTELEIIVHEGKKRQIRRMFGSLNYHVVRLCRVRQGFLSLGGLKPGEWRFLEKEEVERLYKDLLRF